MLAILHQKCFRVPAKREDDEGAFNAENTNLRLPRCGKRLAASGSVGCGWNRTECEDVCLMAVQRFTNRNEQESEENQPLQLY